MKDTKKSKVLSLVSGLDKKINKAKTQLDTLEERKGAIVTESIMEMMTESNLELTDLFNAIEKETRAKAAQAAKTDTTNGGTGANAAFSHNKTENNLFILLPPFRDYYSINP